ncbi:alpha-L-fucosidase [Neobacillus niacini]|uniref:alpha-L-fucosidase n=1 Tax=Neobacillus niacini TaxID=86668 RepID=UPI0007ABC597|nr:alpha-L-fucosidase [Neobacillus niacini]MEC1522071.1 alpha-L-fucosidase [Neobacillus niacini]
MKELMVENRSSVGWFTDARFGMFIHWGLYAAIGKGEWVMYGQKIPVKEYEQLTETFNPHLFNAKEWVSLAKRAGMKYIVITAKHHDGFAMFHSKADKFNIVDSTPFGRDPLKELAEECALQGMKLCFYYSHVIDWHHPHSIHDSANNIWDYHLEEKAFYHYWNRLVKPQVTELLTKYGPIGLIWFDTSGGLSKKDSEEMVQLVKSLQPDCLVNSRVSHWPDFGDFQSKGDNEIPMSGEDTKPWETPMTLNKSWGYSAGDNHYKSTDSIIRKMVNIASKGGNLLLNVGPDERGEIPEFSVEKLKEIGDWMDKNGESIYGTKGSPFPYEFDWGAVTLKENKVFLHIHNQKWSSSSLCINGFKTKVHQVYILSNPQQKISFMQENSENDGVYRLQLELPEEPPCEFSSVIVLELAEELKIDPAFIEQSGVIKLDFGHAKIEREQQQNAAEWQVKITEKGKYEVHLIAYKRTGVDWKNEFADSMKIEIGNESKSVMPNEDDIIEDSETCQHPYTEIHSHLGIFEIERPGLYSLRLHSSRVREKPKGPEIWQAAAVKLRAVKMIKIES